MLEKGRLDGQRVWKRVRAAVKEIQRREPWEGEAVNWEHRLRLGLFFQWDLT